MQGEKSTVVNGESGLPEAILVGTGNIPAGDKIQKAKPGGNGKGNGVQEDNHKESPEEYRERRDKEKSERLAAKLERASKPETMLVTRNAMDTNDLVYLINSFDFQFRGMRDRVGLKGSNITLQIFQEQIDKTEALKDQIHLMNKELSDLTGLKYKAPRGFK